MAGAMKIFAVYGVPGRGFAVLWDRPATSPTVRTLRCGMPFALTWWSLTFLVGMFVTGTTNWLATPACWPSRVAAVLAYVGSSFSTWLLVAVRTARGNPARHPSSRRRRVPGPVRPGRTLAR